MFSRCFFTATFLTFIVILLNISRTNHNDTSLYVGISLQHQIGGKLKFSLFLSRAVDNKRNQKIIQSNTFTLLLILLSGDVELNPGPDNTSKYFIKICKQYIKFRLNINFISLCLASNVIPKGFQFKNACAVTNNKFILNVWRSHLNTVSYKLMRLTCAHYASQLPHIHHEITLNFNRYIYHDVYKDLLKIHRVTCRVHQKKLYSLGVSYTTPPFMPPVPFHFDSASKPSNHCRRFIRKSSSNLTSSKRKFQEVSSATGLHDECSKHGGRSSSITEVAPVVQQIMTKKDSFVETTQAQENDIVSNDTSQANIRSVLDSIISLIKDVDIVRVEGDGRCLFRSVVVCLNTNLQNLTRDKHGKILNTDFVTVEREKADNLRSDLNNFMSENSNLYNDLPDFILNSDQPNDCFSSFKDRLAAMSIPTTSAGDLEISALSNMLKIPILIISDKIKFICLYGEDYFSKQSLVCIRFTNINNSIGHYEAVLLKQTCINTTIPPGMQESQNDAHIQLTPMTNSKSRLKTILGETSPVNVTSINNVTNTNVVNLSSNINIPPAVFDLLDKGNGFCPTPGNFNKFNLIKDTLDYTRRCKLKERFFDEVGGPTDIPKKLYVKSKWNPTSGRNASLDLYCQVMEKEATQYIPTHIPPRNNLSKIERITLKQLSSDPSITIREADKGKRIVIMDTSDYNNTMISMLNNINIYKRLDVDPTDLIYSLMSRHIEKLLDLKIISDKMAEAILFGDPLCPHFYGLPKIHKDIKPGEKLPPFRGIIASVHGPNTRASRWLDSILNPLVPVYCGDHWCKDTMHLLGELEKLKGMGEVNSINHRLATIDVVDMYNSIPHEDGVKAISDALVQHTSYSRNQIKAIVNLVSFILNNNCFRFGDLFFKQIRGTAMGSPFAPAYANIFMAYFQKTFISPTFYSAIHWLKRFIDDIITILPVDFDYENFLDHLNSCHPTVKFTMSNPSLSDPFLDIRLSLTPSGISTDLFSKPTDSHRYLRPTSSHPKHIFRSIVHSGALRIRRICSEDTSFQQRLSDFSNHLLSSGYTSSFIDPILKNVAKKERKGLLIQSHKCSSSNRIPFVTTYHPHMPKIKSFHDRHNTILTESDRMSKVLPKPPIIALKRPRNLGDILIKTKTHLQINKTISYKGFQSCGQPRCQICHCGGRYGILSSKIKSSKTGNTFMIKSNLNCNSSNCIYVISCAFCKKQYAGQTITPLRLRFNNHRKDVRKNDIDKTLAVHFNLPGHSGEKDLRIQAVELVPYNVNIDSRESFWMWNLSCHNVNGGLNIEEPYFEKLCLTN